MATFAEMQTEVQFHIGDRQDLNSFVQDKINEALLEVMLLVKPPEFFDTFAITTSDGTEAYSITGDSVVAVLGVRNETDNKRLKRGTYEEFDEMDEDDTGEPKKWFRYGNEVILYNRVPDSNSGDNYSITVRTLERPTVLSADSDSFPLGLEWEEPVVLRASEKMFILLNQQEAATLKGQQFATSVTTIVERYQSLEDEADHDAGMRLTSHQLRPSTARSRR